MNNNYNSNNEEDDDFYDDEDRDEDDIEIYCSSQVIYKYNLQYYYIFIRKFKIILDYDYCNLNKYIFIAFFRRQ